MKTLFSKKRLLSGVLSVVMLLTALLSVTTMTQAASTNLRDHIVEIKAVMSANDWNVDQAPSHIVTDDQMRTLFNGDYTDQVFVANMTEWNPPKFSGVYVELDAAYDIDKIVLHSGVTGYPDTLKVHATTSDCIFPLSASLQGSLVAEGIQCVDRNQPVDVEIGRKAQYIAIFNTSGAWRPYEIEILGETDEEEPDQGEDTPVATTMLTGTALSEVKAVMSANNWNVDQAPSHIVTDDQMRTLFNGDYTDQVFVSDMTEWNPAKFSGVYVELDAAYDIDKIVLHSGQTGYPDTLKVHATTSDCIFPVSDSLESSLVAEGIECVDHNQPVEVEVDRKAQYIAIFNTSGAWRPYEIEIHAVAEEVSTGLTDTGAGILGQELINNKQGLRFNNKLVTKVVDDVETVTVDGEAHKVTGIGMLVTKRTGAEMTVENAADAANGILKGKVTSAKNVVQTGDTVTYDFSILVKNVNFANIDTMITSRAYVEYQDGDETKVLYGDVQTTSVKEMYDSLPADQFSDAVKHWMETGEVGQ